MESIILNEDIKVICVRAKSFPHGIVEAFKTLENLDPTICERPFYGISSEDNDGNIIYKAAVAEAYEGEGAKFNCEIFVIRKGKYLVITLKDYMKRLGC